MALSVFAISILIPELSRAATACAVAPMLLQQYINQVNQVANSWLYQGIPLSCGYNQYCQAGIFQQLNIWYQQQAVLVNQWYYQIAATCTNDAEAERHRFSPSRPGDQTMNEGATEELHVDRNENKSVAIVIPDNPTGFHGR